MENKSVQINSTLADAKSDRANAKELPTEIEIQSWIINHVAELLEVEPDGIDIMIPFDRYGLDSVAAYEITGDLETWLDRELDPTLMYNYPTIESLSQHLSSIQK